MKKINLLKKLHLKRQKNLSRKEKLLPVILFFKINRLNQLKNQRKHCKKIHPKNISSKVKISKNSKRRQKKLGASSLDVWLNTTTKRFTSVLPTLKISLLTRIQFVERSISQKPGKFQTKTANLLTSYYLIQIIGL